MRASCVPSPSVLQPVSTNSSDPMETLEQLRAQVPDLSIAQRGMRGFLKTYSSDIVGEMKPTKLTAKSLPKANRLTVQSHPTHLDAFPSINDGGQIIAYNFPAYHPFGVAVRSVGCLRTGNGLGGTVAAASAYLSQGKNRKLWMAPMGRLHREPMEALVQAEKVPSGAAVIALKTGAPIVVEAVDPVAAKENDVRLLKLVAIAGGVGTIFGGALAVLVSRDSKDLVTGLLKGVAAAMVTIPASIAGSVLAGLKIAAAPKPVVRVVSDVIYPKQIENLDSQNKVHISAKLELQEEIHKACDKATKQAAELGRELISKS